MSSLPDVVIAFTLSACSHLDDIESLKRLVFRILVDLKQTQRFSLIAFHSELVGFRDGRFCTYDALREIDDWLDSLPFQGQAQLSVLQILLGRIELMPTKPAVLVLCVGPLPPAETTVQAKFNSFPKLLMASIGCEQTAFESWVRSTGAQKIDADLKPILELLEPDPFAFDQSPQVGYPVAPADLILLVSTSSGVSAHSFLQLKLLAAQLLRGLPSARRFALIGLGDDQNLSGYRNGEFATPQEKPAALEWLGSLARNESGTPALLSTIEMMLGRIEYLNTPPLPLVLLLLSGSLGTDFLCLTRRYSLHERIYLVGIDIHPGPLSQLRKSIGAEILAPTPSQILDRLMLV
jgi:hypothetical protein